MTHTIPSLAERNNSYVRGVTTLDFLLGTWSVERWIDDALSGHVETFHGTATFVKENDDEPRVRFEEAEVVRFGEYSGRASRRLVFSGGRGSTFDVSFADGHHFIELDLREGSSKDHHQCASDGYDVTTIVIDNDRIEEQWRVRGPAKNYVAVTAMTRVT
jgi:hypothetical protein